MDTPLISKSRLQIQHRVLLSLFLLSAATLAYEINLTRLFSVAQFYHFAFMIVSIALLGYGASGTILAIFPSLQRGIPAQSLSRLSLGAGISMVLSYLLINWLPFDSYSLLVDQRQVFILILHYIALATPFFFTGMAIRLLLTQNPGQTGSIYGVNLLGSAVGCVLALLAPVFVGGEGMVTLCALLAGLAALISTRLQPIKSLINIGIAALLLFTLIDLSLHATRQAGLAILNLHISPYKSLSYALQSPSSQVTYSRWNAFSRVDLISSGAIHTLPGLSYRYMGPLPKLDGLLVDGDNLSPVVQASTGPEFTQYLPAAVAFLLHPLSNTLILEPRGGLDILSAMSDGTGWVTAVEVNPLIIEAAPAYQDARLFLHQESERSFLQRSRQQYDVILLSLVSSFHPVQSGAYTLAEDYRYTLESFKAMLDHLAPGGVLLATRWLQDPPSEDLRLFALAVESIEARGGDPARQLVAFRGYNTGTILVKNEAFTEPELSTIRQFAASRAYDLSYAPGIDEDETNQYNILPTATYYHTYLNLLQSVPRQSFYDTYPYDVRPPTDDHPFFGHYFKWQQAPEILAELGKAWLPFGGGGYFVILALLILATALAVTLILLPVGVWKLKQKSTPTASAPFPFRNLLYFGLLGFAFLFVEIPLMQRFILYVGNPAYAVTLVLFSLLLFSGLGSHFSLRVPVRLALVALSVLILLLPLFLPKLFEVTLGLPLTSRIGVAVIALGPVGFLMGIPFPAGIRLLTGGSAQPSTPDGEIQPRSDIPWVWAVNGSASVVAPILAALLALSINFSAVVLGGAMCYALALLTVCLSPRSGIAPHPTR
jgi:hypothetical protein